MKVEAVKGFSGFLNGKSFSMHAGEVREVEEDNETVQELLDIGYLMRTFEPENTENTEETPNAPEPDEVKLNEDKRGKSKRS